MTSDHHATDGTAAESTSSPDSDWAQGKLRSPRDFLRGEVRTLWPLLVLALVMLVVILKNTLVPY